MLPPSPGAPKTEPTRLSPSRVRVFSPKGGNLSWSLPRDWVGKTVKLTTLTPEGAKSGPAATVEGDTLRLSDVPAAMPVILTVPSVH